MIEEDLDAEVERVARETDSSKAAVIRRLVRQGLQPLPPLSADPLWQMVGVDDAEPANVDDVVYG